MKTIFLRTLTSMFKPITIVIYFAATIGITLLISIVNSYNDSFSSLIIVQSLQVREIFLLLFFIWISGLTLTILVMAIGSGVFATEEAEGTMRILLGKPITREAVIFGKIFGLIIGSFIYMLVSIIISITIYSIVIKVDKDVFISLIKLLPSFVMYSIFIIVFFSGITVLFSSIFKKRIPTIIILMVLIIATFGIMPIIRNITMSSGSYQKYKVYLIDTNYHFGSMYMKFLEKDRELQVSPSIQQTMGMFTGVYYYYQDPDLSNQENMYNMSMTRNNSLNANYILIIYTIIGLGSYTLCYIRMKNKDIN